MNHSFLKTTQIIISLLVSLLFLFSSIATGQSSCDTWDYGFTAGPAIAGTIEARLDTFCNSSPQDIVVINFQGLVVTVHNVYSRGEAGGTAACTNYPKADRDHLLPTSCRFFRGSMGRQEGHGQ